MRTAVITIVPQAEKKARMSMEGALSWRVKNKWAKMLMYCKYLACLEGPWQGSRCCQQHRDDIDDFRRDEDYVPKLTTRNKQEVTLNITDLDNKSIVRLVEASTAEMCKRASSNMPCVQ